MPTPDDLRSGINGLAQIAANDLDGVWRAVQDAVDAREALFDILPGLIDQYGAAAATFAADWYDEVRADAEMRTRFTAIPADVGDRGADQLAGWGTQPLYQPVPDWATALTLLQGGLQRRIANVARDTVTGSSIADPSARGWQRVGRGECSFCAMLIGRGAVYTETTADFASHDHCNCAAVPAFEGQSRPVKPYKVSTRRELGPDGKPLPISAADRHRVQEYIRDH